MADYGDMNRVTDNRGIIWGTTKVFVFFGNQNWRIFNWRIIEAQTGVYRIFLTYAEGVSRSFSVFVACKIPLYEKGEHKGKKSKNPKISGCFSKSFPAYAKSIIITWNIRHCLDGIVAQEIAAMLR